MNILFVSSGNTKEGISPIVYNQGISLQEIGHKITFFTIKEKGIKGYLKYIFILRNYLKDNPSDIVHAHYSLSAFAAALAGAKPMVVSLMGSDVKASPLLKYIIRIFKNIFWKKVIVKSEDMKASVKLSNVSVVPNGVDFSKFKPISREQALKVTGWDTTKKHVLFAANPKRREKNYPLAEKGFRSIDSSISAELHTLTDIPNLLMPAYFNAADVVLLTSLWEGSPNVIKEAMACNCKIVAVDVGDVKQVIGDTDGCFITDSHEQDISNKLEKALKVTEKTTGRTKISHLSSALIAEKLVTIYSTIT
ncbi:glycosyltransferase family 4 protein [Maribacter sp. 2307UL18-2]|uniref:glycosyltransferase family 4 protein n=1 Tax=Maribacter sp. 2307UL18-2 TaxID=3386274 RepID=UPI0039BD37FC